MPERWDPRKPRSRPPHDRRDKSRFAPKPKPVRPPIGEGVAILYGWHTVAAALANPRRTVRKIFATENAAHRLTSEGLALPVAPEIVRGMDEQWVKNVYSIALVPDAVFYLNVSPEELVQRNVAKSAALDYWESGMDIGLSRDIFDSFLQYQRLMAEQFQRMQTTYGFTIVDAHRSVTEIYADLQKQIELVLNKPA